MNLVWALLAFFASAQAQDLRPGDLILQSQPCFLCALIEIEEGLPYSHVGVVVQEPGGALFVLEAWNKVGRVALTEFLQRKRKGTEALVIRPAYRASFAQNPATLNQWLRRQFSERFAGHSYDRDFLWNNGDGNGESYYCSELVAKLINPILLRPLQTKPMHFQKNRQHWLKYFDGNPPDGRPGISPADIARNLSSQRFNYF